MTSLRKPAAAILALALSLMATQASAAERSLALPRLNPRLKAYLAKEFGPPDAADEAENPTRAVSAAVPLSDTKTEVVVYVIGRSICGTGGCPLLVLEFDGTTYRKIGEVMGQVPIRLIPGPYGQHPDLTITVNGGGNIEGYTTKLHFADGHYPIIKGLMSGPALKRPNAGDLMIGDDDEERAEPIYR